MNRLIFTGLPCSAQNWKNLYTSKDDRVITLFEVIQNSEGRSVFSYIKYVREIILSSPKSTIICHDWGGYLCLSALTSIERKKIKIKSCVCILNTRIHPWNIFNTPYVLTLLFGPKVCSLGLAANQGSIVDSRLKKHWLKVRLLYLFTIVGSVLSLFGKIKIPIKIGIPSMIIASPSDIFIPITVMSNLQKELSTTEYHELSYGHFPKLEDLENINLMISNFEQKIRSSDAKEN